METKSTDIHTCTHNTLLSFCLFVLPSSPLPPFTGQGLVTSPSPSLAKVSAPPAPSFCFSFFFTVFLSLARTVRFRQTSNQEWPRCKYSHQTLLCTMKRGCGLLACSCRAECGAMEMCPSLLQRELDQRRHGKSCFAVAAHSLSLLTALSMSSTTAEDDTLPRKWAHVQALLARRVRFSFSFLCIHCALEHKGIADKLEKSAMPK